MRKDNGVGERVRRVNVKSLGPPVEVDLWVKKSEFKLYEFYLGEDDRIR